MNEVKEIGSNGGNQRKSLIRRGKPLITVVGHNSQMFKKVISTAFDALDRGPGGHPDRYEVVSFFGDDNQSSNEKIQKSKVEWKLKRKRASSSRRSSEETLAEVENQEA